MSAGIDSRVRRKFKGALEMPNIGYGSNNKTRHVLPIGFKKFIVNNVKDLELLMMHNRCAVCMHVALLRIWCLHAPHAYRGMESSQQGLQPGGRCIHEDGLSAPSLKSGQSHAVSDECA